MSVTVDYSIKLGTNNTIKIDRKTSVLVPEVKKDMMLCL